VRGRRSTLETGARQRVLPDGTKYDVFLDALPVLTFGAATLLFRVLLLEGRCLVKHFGLVRDCAFGSGSNQRPGPRLDACSANPMFVGWVSKTDHARALANTC
jgi:hypothetical protein